MIVINIAAEHISLLSVSCNDTDLIAIGNTELLVIVRVNKSNSFCSAVQMIISPLALVAITVDVIHAAIRVKTEHIGIVFGVYAEAEVILTGHHP